MYSSSSSWWGNPSDEEDESANPRFSLQQSRGLYQRTSSYKAAAAMARSAAAEAAHAQDIQRAEGSEHMVLYSWEAEHDGDLGLVAGRKLVVLNTHANGWWYGRNVDDDATGYFPRCV
jgi:hypothetical protein